MPFKTFSKWPTVTVIGLSMTVVASFAFAHRGVQSRHDLGPPIWIEGEVTAANFGNPHSELTVQVAADLTVPRPAPTLGPASSFLNNAALNVPDDLPGTAVELEMPPPTQYADLSDRIAVGDRIAAVAIRNCEAPYRLNIHWLRLADGSIESRHAAVSHMVDQC